MKKLFLSFLVAIVAMGANAQLKVRMFFACFFCMFFESVFAQTSELNYRPFAKDNKVWKTQVGGIMENVYVNIIDGDTVINGKDWKKVYNYTFSPDFNYTYYAAIRDAGKKVYAIAKGSTRPRLLYDFGLKVDDMVRCGIEGNSFGCLLDADEKPDNLLGFPFVSYLRVEGIDTIRVRGMEHRRFTFIMLDAFRERMQMIDKIVWIEGVGSGAGPFSPWMPLPPRGAFFQSCEIDKTCIFGYPDFYESYEPDILNIPQSARKKSTMTYDLQGRRLDKIPQKEIYIQNGKKKTHP